MKKKMILAALMGTLALTSCQQKGDGPTRMTTPADAEKTLPTNITECNFRLGNLAFTHALNRADTCISLKEQDLLEFRCTEKRDIFCDPNGKLTNNTVPILLSAIDNTQPFTFTAKVTPGFTPEGLYNAAETNAATTALSRCARWVPRMTTTISNWMQPLSICAFHRTPAHWPATTRSTGKNGRWCVCTRTIIPHNYG